MTQLAPLSPTPRSTQTRNKKRAVAEREALYRVLDEGLVCHLGLLLGGSPVVLPTGYGRDEDTLYLHGSTGSPSMRAAAEGVDLCVTVTLLDGVVYARSVNDHSMNYRCAIVHGKPRLVTDPDEKLHGLRTLTEHLSPGSWDYARKVNGKEFAAVMVVALDLAEASVKMRTGGPADEPEDVEAGVTWAGVLPVRTSFGPPIPAADLAKPLPVPAHVSERTGPSSRFSV